MSNKMEEMEERQARHILSVVEHIAELERQGKRDVCHDNHDIIYYRDPRWYERVADWFRKLRG